MKKYSFVKLLSLFLTVVFLFLSLPVFADQNEDKKDDIKNNETAKEETQTQTEVKELRDASYLSADVLPTPDDPTVVVENSDYFISAARAAAQTEKEVTEPDRSVYYTGLEEGYYIIQSLYNGRYFHHTQANNTLNVWSYSEQTYQHWYISKNTDDNSYTFRPLDNLCLAVEVYNAQLTYGNPLTLYSYAPGNQSTSFRFYLKQNSDYTLSIIPVLGGTSYALEVYHGPNTSLTINGRTFSKQDGITVQLAQYDENIRQKWSFQELIEDPFSPNPDSYVPYDYNKDIESGTYFIESKYNHNYLFKNSTNNIVNVSAPYGGANQQWIITRNPDNTYSFRLKANTNLYLELYCGVNAEGQPITVYNYTGNESSPYIKYRIRKKNNNIYISPLTAPTMCIGVFVGDTGEYPIGGEAIPKINGVTVELHYISYISKNYWNFHKVPNSIDNVCTIPIDEVLFFEDAPVPDILKPGGVLYSTIYWCSANTSIVEIDNMVGCLSPVNVGSAVIYGCDGFGNIYFSYRADVLIIPEGIYFLKNKRSGDYTDIEEVFFQTGFEIETHDYTGLDSQRWKFEYLQNGYYSIKSMNFDDDYYLSVDNDSTVNGAEIVLRARVNGELTDGMKWRIESTASGAFKLIPKSGEIYNYVLSEGTYDPIFGTPLFQLEYSNDSPYNDEWYFKTFTATVNVYYDNGYSVRNNETSVDSEIMIIKYLQKVRNIYLVTFGLDISYSTPTYYASALDICKGTVTNSNIDTLCTHGGVIHSDKENVKADFIVNHTGDENTINALFSGHKICTYEDPDNPENNEYNRSFSSPNTYAIYLLNYRNWFYAVILFHELNHQFGAPDHYHEEDKYHNCINPLYCSTCGSQKRPEECVMNGSTNLNELCDGCKNDILTHLRIYNFVD